MRWALTVAALTYISSLAVAAGQQQAAPTPEPPSARFDMEVRAVELAPDNVGVRIPRGATLLEATRFIPENQREALIRLAVGDYEHTLTLQKAIFSGLSDHAKGELLFGPGRRLGEARERPHHLREGVARGKSACESWSLCRLPLK